MEKLTYSQAKRYRAQKVYSDFILLEVEPVLKERRSLLVGWKYITKRLSKDERKELAILERTLRQIRAIKAERTVFEQDIQKGDTRQIWHTLDAMLAEIPDCEKIIDGHF